MEGEGTMYKRILKTLTVGLALLVVFPVGNAMGKQIGDPATYAVQSSKPIVSEKIAGLNLVTQSVKPIVSEKVAGLNLVTQSSTPIVSEKIGGLQLSSSETTTVAATGSGFDWNDAGIGAIVMFGSLLAASALALTFRRHGRLAH
jgi:hypothetical protein